MATPQPPQKEYIIGGVKVLFPIKPYPSQMAMMAQIVKGLHRRQNCLLESPTGSGKSLALLCSTLAWHQAEKEKAQRYNDLIFQGVTDPDILARAVGLANAPPTQIPQSGISSTPPAPRPSQDAFNTTATQQQQQSTAAAAAAAATGGGFMPEGDADDADFRSQTRQFRNPIGMEIPLGGGGGGMNESSAEGEDLSFMMEDGFNPNERRPPLMRVPKIYFGTRTHKQIYQVVRELRRTAYKHVKTTVLSSREHTCIHPSVSKLRNKNEGCQQLNDPREGSGCRFKHGVNKIKTHDKLSEHGMQPAWDIEDMVTLGKKIVACPYFSARSLKETADVVFCPYNYLVDPLIRESMSIDLKNQIIVLDEAHNIEDSARESTSCTIKQDDVMDSIQELQKMVKYEFCIQECTALAQMLTALTGWIDLNKDNLTDYKEFDRSGKIFTGTEMVAHLNQLHIGRDRYEELKRCLSTISADQDPEQNSPKVKTPTLMFLKGIFLMFHFLFLDNMKYRDDYRIALVKSQIRNSGKRGSDGFFSRRGSLDWEYSLNFWCLNPGVAFISLGNDARSIILTSGTLSPMNSFQSELAVPFPIQLEANHVIDKSQVWVGTIGRGPTDQELQATYRNTETWEFQDELGRLVLNVCKVIPHGVLCFLPSYSMLNKLLERWQCTGLWDEISKIKIPMTEPRRSDEFETTMSLFYDTIRDTKETEAGCGINGAFFMAVCRGKVSEGLDFTDDNARAVISVGIPFPNVKDIQVDLKRQYNNQHCKSRGLLPGSEWYEIQAYRALNQALGRCIRHRYDWGALILVDERYQRGQLSGGTQQTKYTRGLSKWVRNKLVHHRSFPQALYDLRQFAENMIANPPVKPESLDESLIVDTQDSTKQKESLLNNSNKHAFGSSHMTSADSSLDLKLAQSLSSASGGLSNQYETVTVPCPSQIEESSYKIEGLNTSVVACLNTKSEDSDFLSDGEDLVIPPSRVPFTSTQVYGLKDDLSVPPIGIPSTLTQVSSIESDSLVPSDKTPSVSSQVFELKKDLLIPPTTTTDQSSKIRSDNQTSDDPVTVISPHAGLVSSYFDKPKDTMKIRSLVKKSQPSKKRKSFSLTDENMTPLSTRGLSANLPCDTKDIESVSEVDLETEISVVLEVKQSKRRLLDITETDCEQKENIEIRHQITESRIDEKGKCSPQMFDSDEDIFSDYSPSKRLPKSNSCTPSKIESHSKEERYTLVGGASAESSKDSSTTKSLLMDESANYGKENKFSKKMAKSSLPCQVLVNTPDKSLCEDSDMEDFCLDKSYSTPKVKKMRRLSKSKPTVEDQ